MTITAILLLTWERVAIGIFLRIWKWNQEEKYQRVMQRKDDSCIGRDTVKRLKNWEMNGRVVGHTMPLNCYGVKSFSIVIPFAFNQPN